jgi:hypothetical protein
VRIHDDFFDEAIAALAVGVGEPVKQRVLLRVFGLVEQVVPFFDAHEVPLNRVLTDRGTEYCGSPDTRASACP